MYGAPLGAGEHGRAADVRTPHSGRSRRGASAGAVVATSVAGNASHGAFTTSAGISRVPYANGLEVTANNDHHTHPNAVNRIDLATQAELKDAEQALARVRHAS